MDKMKRVFSFLLAFVITLGAFSSFGYVALADEAEEVKPVEEVATEFLDKVPADVKGTDYEKAVRRLVAFGIIEGFPDGTFKPENELTRAEFSKMVVIALGLEDAAKAMENKKTEFGDVYVGHWAQGYINVASSQGLIKGYEDGTFRPSNQVTYAEAVTILVRALGYQDSFLYGKWPNNYITKAADLGISGPVDIPNYDNNAIRGNVARLLDLTLGKNVIKVVEYEGTAITYEPTNIPLRQDKLGIHFLANGRLVGDMYVDKDLKENQVKVYKKDSKLETSKEIMTASLEKSAADYREFIGEQVDIFYKHPGAKVKEVILLENEGTADVEFDFIKHAETKRDGTRLMVELAGHNGKYELADDAFFYIMGEDTYAKYNGKSEIKDVLTSSLPGRVGKVVVEDGEIVYGEIMSKDLVAKDFLVVTDVEEDAIVGISGARGDHKIGFSDKSKYEEVHVFDQNGKRIEVKDIEAGDVVYAQKQYFDKKDSLFIVAVQDNNVTGELGRTAKDRFEIDEEYVDVAKHGDTMVARVSTDLLETSEVYDIELASELHKEDVIAYRGAGNLVVMLAANDESAGAKYGVITRVYEDEIEVVTSLDGKMKTVRLPLENEDDIWDDYLKVRKADGSLTKNGKKDGKWSDVVKVEETDNKTTPEILNGQPVKFRTANDKVVKGSLEFINLDAKFSVEGENKVTFGPNSIYEPKEARSFKVTPGAKVIEAYGLDYNKVIKGELSPRDLRDVAKDTVIYDYEDIANTEFAKDEGAFNYAVITRANGDVEAVVIFDKGADLLTDVHTREEAIIVTDLGKRGDDFDAKYHSYQSGEQTEKGSNFRKSEVEAGELALIEINRRGRVEVLGAEHVSEIYKPLSKTAGLTVKNDVIKDSRDELKTNNGNFKLANGVVVYDNTGRKLKQVEYYEIEKDDVIDAIVTKGGIAEVIVINPTDKAPEVDAELKDDRVYEVKDVFQRRDVNYVVLFDTVAGEELPAIEIADNLVDTAGDKLKNDLDFVTVTARKLDGDTVITDVEKVEVTVTGTEAAYTTNEDKTEVTVHDIEIELTSKDVNNLKYDIKNIDVEELVEIDAGKYQDGEDEVAREVSNIAYDAEANKLTFKVDEALVDDQKIIVGGLTVEQKEVDLSIMFKCAEGNLVDLTEDDKLAIIGLESIVNGSGFQADVNPADVKIAEESVEIKAFKLDEESVEYSEVDDFDSEGITVEIEDGKLVISSESNEKLEADNTILEITFTVEKEGYKSVETTVKLSLVTGEPLVDGENY